jgi:membrane-associated phospholipid phosphatase
MTTELIQLDHAIFEWVQLHLRNGLLDKLLPLWRSMYFWIPLYIYIIFYLINHFPLRKAINYLVLILLVFLGTDTITAKMIKPSIKRERPCNDIAIKNSIKKIINCGNGFSFPSSHAANHMGLSVILILIFKDWKNRFKLILFLWALSIGFAQVYVGLHYPFDVFIGFILGFVVAISFYFGFRKLGINELD